MLGFQGGVSIPLVKGGVKAPPAKRQCRAGPKAGARRGFTLPTTPTTEDASLILVRQLIAAKLNVANGSDPTSVSAIIANADSLRSGFAGKLPYYVQPSSATGQAMVNDATVLDSYNHGDLTLDCTP